MKLVIAAAGLMASAAMAAPAAPVYNPATQQYFVTGLLSLPFGNLSIPFSSYYDGVGGRQNLQYYGGLNVYVYRQDANVTWQLSPEVNVMACFGQNGSTSLTTLLPDTTGYQFLSEGVVNGIKVNTYQLVTSQGQKTAVYNLSVSSADNFSPIQLSFIGRDLVIGSHSDAYVFSYYSFVPGTQAWPQGIFDQPAEDCGAFPVPPGDDGSSVLQTEGNGLIRELLGSLVPLHPTEDKHYSAYLAQYGKSYSSEEELRLRHSRFTGNRRLIHVHNKKNKVEKKSLRLAMNFLGDATEAEMNLRMGRRADGSSHKKNGPLGATAFPEGAGPLHIHKAPADVSALPSTVSWVGTAMEPVQDQGICGSCYIFGATAAIAGQYYLKYGRSVVFSKQEAVDCAWNFGVDGCGGGNDFLIYQWAMNNGGIASRDQYGPYLSMNGFCKANSAGISARLKGWVAVQNNSAPALMDAIANVGPISISVDAAVPAFIFYSSGVIDDPLCSSNPNDQDHTILAAGYGTDPATGLQYWLVRNHWSTYWGDNGMAKIAIADNDCGVTDAPTYPVLV